MKEDDGGEMEKECRRKKEGDKIKNYVGNEERNYLPFNFDV
jgi:hypothetical protein